MSNTKRLFKPFTTSVATLVFIGLSVLSTNIHAVETAEAISVVKKAKGEKQHKGSSYKKYFKRLDLSEEQKEQLKVIHTESKAEFNLYKEDEKSYKNLKKELLAGDTLNEDSLADLYTQYQNTFAAIELVRVKKMFAVKQVLTEEQFTKLTKMMKKKKGKKGKNKKKMEA